MLGRLHQLQALGAAGQVLQGQAGSQHLVYDSDRVDSGPQTRNLLLPVCASDFAARLRNHHVGCNEPASRLLPATRDLLQLQEPAAHGTLPGGVAPPEPHALRRVDRALRGELPTDFYRHWAGHAASGRLKCHQLCLSACLQDCVSERARRCAALRTPRDHRCQVLVALCGPLPPDSQQQKTQGKVSKVHLAAPTVSQLKSNFSEVTALRELRSSTNGPLFWGPHEHIKTV